MNRDHHVSARLTREGPVIRLRLSPTIKKLLFDRKSMSPGRTVPAGSKSAWAKDKMPATWGPPAALFRLPSLLINGTIGEPPGPAVVHIDGEELG